MTQSVPMKSGSFATLRMTALGDRKSRSLVAFAPRDDRRKTGSQLG